MKHVWAITIITPYAVFAVASKISIAPWATHHAWNQ